MRRERQGGYATLANQVENLPPNFPNFFSAWRVQM
jgi:hypothetical protein